MEDRGTIVHGEGISPEMLAIADDVKQRSPVTAALETPIVACILMQAEMVPGTARRSPAAAPTPKRDRKAALKKAISKMARRIGYRYGIEFRTVHVALNQAIGVRSVNDAGEEQRERMLEIAQQWLTTGVAPGSKGAA